MSGRTPRPSTAGSARGNLGVEIAVLDHAGQLDDALQVHLAPAAADLRRAQGAGERAGLPAEFRRDPVQRGDLLAESGVGADPVPLDLVQPPLDPLQGVRRGHRARRPRRRRATPARRRAAEEDADDEAEDEQQRPDEQGRGIHAAIMAGGTDSRARRAER